MTEGAEPIIKVGIEQNGEFVPKAEFDYDTDTGDYIVTHKDDDAQLRYDSSENRLEKTFSDGSTVTLAEQ